MTNDLARRVWEHKRKTEGGFAARYNATWLVYFEQTTNVAAAIAREKQIKDWRRAKKVALVKAANPQWRDLAAEEGFFDPIGRRAE